MKVARWLGNAAMFAALGLLSSCLEEPPGVTTIDPTDLQCDACHGSDGDPAPPMDLSGSTDTASVGVGAHRSHTDPSTWHAVVACDACHLVPASAVDPSHMDTYAPAEVVFGTIASNDNATPSWDGTACAGVYCHGDTLADGLNTSPIWTAVDGSQVTCGSCHGLPPGPPHSALSKCHACHEAVVDSASQFVDASLHINGNVDFDVSTCDSCHVTPTSGDHVTHVVTRGYHCTTCHDDYVLSPTHGDETFDTTGVVSFDATNPSGTYDEATSTCGNLYCHGSGAAIWGGPVPGCGDCHGLPPNPPHAQSNLCGDCHAAVADSTPQIVDPALHIDGTVTYAFSGATCTLCHTSTSSGHTGHVSGLSYGCTTCHDGYGSSPNHYNGRLEGTGLVNFDSNNPSGTYNEGAYSCGNLWCHGPNSVSPDPVWGGAVPTCGNCHPNPPTGGSHVVHTGNDFSDPAAPKYAFACAECHNGINTAVPHVDFAVDVALDTSAGALATGYGANDGNIPTWNAGPRTCSDVYCHSNGVTKEKGAAYDLADIGSPPDGTLSYNTPTWGGSVACGDCHAGAPLSTIAGPSDYPSSGEHQRNNHVNSNVGGYTFVQCFWCHATSSAEALQGTYGSSEHVDGVLKFHPYSTSSGGTMWPNSNKTYQDGHCGDGGGSCWY